MLTLNFNSVVLLRQAVFARLQMSIPSKPGGWESRGWGGGYKLRRNPERVRRLPVSC